MSLRQCSRAAPVLLFVVAATGVALPPNDAWVEMSDASVGVPPCGATQLQTRIDATLETPAEDPLEEKCTKLSLCNAMIQLDARTVIKHKCAKCTDKLECVESEGPNCQASYYSAYKCKALLVDAAQSTKSNGGTGKMCTANSFGMVAETDTACGRLLDWYGKMHDDEKAGKLRYWISNEMGPAIWSTAGHPAMCSVTRRNKIKYALVNCSALPDANTLFSPSDVDVSK